MDEIELIEPNIKYAGDIWTFRDEIFRNAESGEIIRKSDFLEQFLQWNRII